MKSSTHFRRRFVSALLISFAAVAVAAPAGQAKYLTPSSDTQSSTGQLDPIIANAVRNEVRSSGQIDPIMANAIRNSEQGQGGQKSGSGVDLGLVATRLGSPDPRDRALLSRPQIVPSTDRGFAWEDFGIGIAAALAVLFLFAVVLRTKHRREAR